MILWIKQVDTFDISISASICRISATYFVGWKSGISVDDFGGNSGNTGGNPGDLVGNSCALCGNSGGAGDGDTGDDCFGEGTGDKNISPKSSSDEP